MCVPLEGIRMAGKKIERVYGEIGLAVGNIEPGMDRSEPNICKLRSEIDAVYRTQSKSGSLACVVAVSSPISFSPGCLNCSP